MIYDESTIPSQENFEKWLIEHNYDVDENYYNNDLWNQYLIIPSTYNPKEEEDDCDGFGFDDIIQVQKETKELELKFREWQLLHPYVRSQGLGVEAEQYFLFIKSIEEEHMWDIE